MATAAVDTETLPEFSFEGILNADSSVYPPNWPAFPDFLDQPFDVKNTLVQETTNLDSENIFDSGEFNLDVYSDGNYEFDMCRIPDPPWDSHIDPAVLQNDLQNSPAILPQAFVEESSSNPKNSVTPFQQFLNIALPEDTLQSYLQEDPEDSSGGICTNRPKQPRFPPESVAILKIWLEKHMENPYPTSQEKIELAAMTHLSVQQVSNWFVNYRQRQLPPKRQMSPMEAWLSGSSDDEAASDDDIRRALQNQRKKGTPMYDIEPRPFQIPGPPSDARSVSTGSIGSISSIRSTGSAFSQCQDAVVSGPPRRGRKRHYGLMSNPLKLCGQSDRNSPKKRKAASDVASDTDGPSSDLNFQCTFCYKRLSSKTWKRHETTQHFPRHQWTCMKNGFRTVYDPSTCQKSVEGFLSPPKSMCVFCNSPDPDESHAVSCHRISQCLENPESDRTFSRKDHLVQHLRRFHNSSLSYFFPESWESKIELDDFEWNCGFCGDSLRGWDIRANHIAKHFRGGETMADWCSNRGVYGPFECLCCPKGPRKFENIFELWMHEMRRSVPFNMDGSHLETSHESGEPQTKAELQKRAFGRLTSFLAANMPGNPKGEEIDKAVWRLLSRATGWEGNDSGSAEQSGEANGISSSQRSAPASNITRNASNDTEGIQDTFTRTEVLRRLAELAKLIKQKGKKHSPVGNCQRPLANQDMCRIREKSVPPRCDLKKHMKRHPRPYGCTFPKCKKNFGSKNDWKRHENSQHFQLETWRCQLLRPDQACCAELFYRREMFDEHLKDKHGMINNNQVTQEIKKQRIGRNGQGQFWCGFCKDIIPLESKRNAAWDERFNHIDIHFSKELKEIEEWLCLEAKKTKGEVLKEMDKNNFDEDDEVDIEDGNDDTNPPDSQASSTQIAALFGSEHVGIMTGIIEAIILKEAPGPAHQF